MKAARCSCRPLEDRVQPRAVQSSGEGAFHYPAGSAWDENTIMTVVHGLDSDAELPADPVPPATQVAWCRSPEASAGEPAGAQG
jgi:hypothetical protein